MSDYEPHNDTKNKENEKKTRHKRCLKRFTESDGEVETFKPKKIFVPANNNSLRQKQSNSVTETRRCKSQKKKSHTGNKDEEIVALQNENIFRGNYNNSLHTL